MDYSRIWPEMDTDWSEAAIQQYVAMESLRAGLLFHADGNGVNKGAFGGNKMKLAGARAGWPDLVYILPARIVWIELKNAKGRVSDSQFELHEEMRKWGCEVYVVKARNGPDAWGAIRRVLDVD